MTDPEVSAGELPFIERIETVRPAKRRLQRSTEERLRIVFKAYLSDEPPFVVALRLGVDPSEPARWLRKLANDASGAGPVSEDVVPASEFRVVEQRIHELEEEIPELHRLIGKLTREIERLQVSSLVNRR